MKLVLLVATGLVALFSSHASAEQVKNVGVFPTCRVDVWEENGLRSETAVMDKDDYSGGMVLTKYVEGSQVYRIQVALGAVGKSHGETLSKPVYEYEMYTESIEISGVKLVASTLSVGRDRFHTYNTGKDIISVVCDR